MVLTEQEILDSKVKIETIENRIGGVYFLIHNDTIVYVGSSVNIYDRIKEHKSHGHKEFDSFNFIECPEEAMHDEENDCIFELVPKYNKTISNTIETGDYIVAYRAGRSQENKKVTIEGAMLDGALYIKLPVEEILL